MALSEQSIAAQEQHAAALRQVRGRSAPLRRKRTQR